MLSVISVCHSVHRLRESLYRALTLSRLHPPTPRSLESGPFGIRLKCLLEVTIYSDSNGFVYYRPQTKFGAR